MTANTILSVNSVRQLNGLGATVVAHGSCRRGCRRGCRRSCYRGCRRSCRVYRS
jgi:hypothetical protein